MLKIMRCLRLLFSSSTLLKTFRFSFFITVILFSCNNDSYEFKVEKLNDGIEIVKNTEVPLFAPEEKKIELKFLFQIGDEDGNNDYILNVPSFMGLDKENNIYINDFDDCRILVFDNSGHFLRSFGKKGRGPGEFITPYPGAVSSHLDLLAVFDVQNSRYQIFNIWGKFKRVIRKKEFSLVNGLHFTPDGYIIALENFHDSDKRIIRILCYDLTGNIISEFFNHSFLNSEFHSNWLKRASMAVDSKGLIYLPAIEMNKYEIQVFNQSGKLKRKITRKSKQYPYSAKEIRRMQEFIKKRKALTGLEYTVPTMRPMVRRFIIDSKDRLWIWTGNYNKKEGWAAIDIFNKEGRFLYQYITNSFWGAIQISGNRLYQILSSSDEYPRLEVYQIIDNL